MKKGWKVFAFHQYVRNFLIIVLFEFICLTGGFSVSRLMSCRSFLLRCSKLTVWCFLKSFLAYVWYNDINYILSEVVLKGKAELTKEGYAMHIICMQFMKYHMCLFIYVTLKFMWWMILSLSPWQLGSVAALLPCVILWSSAGSKPEKDSGSVS